MNSLELLNRSWFLSLNAGPSTPAGCITFATFCAQYTLYIIPLTLLGQWFLGGKAGHQRALFSLVTILMALGLGFICTTIWFHPRPFMVPLGHTWIYHASDTSFPSDHATLFFSAGLSLFLAGARTGGGLILFLSLLWPGRGCSWACISRWIWREPLWFPCWPACLFDISGL